MKQRTFGAGGPRVGEVGLGTWQLGGTEWGDVPEDRALDVLRAAADAGTTFFDTADIYGMGRSETLIGKFLAERRGEFFVATKLGRSPDPGWPANFTLDAMRRHTEGSLRRLGVDALDLTQLHCIPPEEIERGEVFEHLRILRDEGKIIRFGASVESVAEGLDCLAQDGLAALQVIFNVFRQKPAAELFAKAHERNVAIIVRLPLASGLLAGKFTARTRFAPSDHRSFNQDGAAFNVGETFAGLPFAEGVELADALKERVPAGISLAQMALRWCLDHDAVTVVIPGATRAEQARDNAAASELPRLAEALHAHLREFYETRVRARIRGPY